MVKEEREESGQRSSKMFTNCVRVCVCVCWHLLGTLIALFHIKMFVLLLRTPSHCYVYGKVEGRLPIVLFHSVPVRKTET